MIMLPRHLSSAVFAITKEDGVSDWLREASKAIGGIGWQPLGGIPNNVHTVEVASDPALALVERPINGIDALLDLRARELGETAPTPHAGAQRWWGVPPGGLGQMDDRKRQELAALVRVTMLESGHPMRPTIVVQDGGTGQHPDAFPTTLLSLLASNKKSKTHQMGVYNAGGAASYRFARSTFVVSRLAPQLLDGRRDEVGVSLVRYDPLDPEKYKSGTYQYLVAKGGSIIRLDLAALPELPFGTYIKLVEYELSKYARAAQEPKSSLWHLFHTALPSPPLPIQIIETRADRFPGVRGVERRTVAGMLYLLSRPTVADYSDVRSIDLGPTVGTVELRYFVLNEGRAGGAHTHRKRRTRPRNVRPSLPPVDDSLMLDSPDMLSILTNPVRIHPGSTSAIRLAINAKNDFLPRHASGLSVVVGPELAQYVHLRTTGRLLGGQVRLTLEAKSDAPLTASELRVALVVPALTVLLTATGRIEVASVKEKKDDPRHGGEPDIDVRWVGRDKWEDFDPHWNAETVGACVVKRDDPVNKDAVTRVEWILNENFQPYEQLVGEKRLGEEALIRFRERYEYPVLFGMFKQRLAEETKEREADEQGRQVEVPDDYVRGELARMSRAVLMAMEPEIVLSEAAEVA